MSKIGAAFAFYMLGIVLLPVSLLGYVIWVGKLLAAKRSGVSASAQGPLSARLTMHNFGVWDDQAASRLLPILPGVPWLGMRVAFWPVVFAHRVTGFVPKTFRYPFECEIPPQAEASARVTFFDSAVDRFLPGIDQFVILGAGFDTRLYGLPQDRPVRSFEVDAPKTQAVKRGMLDKAGIDAHRVTFVAADFEKEDWLAKFVDRGFDPARPALFLWEGVTMYLDREAVEDTMGKVASCAKGSLVALDNEVRSGQYAAVAGAPIRTSPIPWVGAPRTAYARSRDRAEAGVGWLRDCRGRVTRMARPLGFLVVTAAECQPVDMTGLVSSAAI